MPAGPTLDPIVSYVVPTTTSSVSLTSLPQGYTDLEIRLAIKITAGGLAIKPNSNSSSVYSGTHLRGNGSTASSSRLTTGDLGGTGLYLVNGSVSTSNFSVVTLHLQAYSQANTPKTALARFSNPDNLVGFSALFANFTAAIASLDFSCDGGGQIVAGSTFDVYGIASA